jgi:hypothetical protein
MAKYSKLLQPIEEIIAKHRAVQEKNFGEFKEMSPVPPSKAKRLSSVMLPAAVDELPTIFFNANELKHHITPLKQAASQEQKNREEKDQVVESSPARRLSGR